MPVTVSVLRMKASTITLVLSVLVVTGGSAFAQAMCVAKHHGCRESAKISNCCCSAQASSRIESTPVQDRVEVRGDMSVVPILRYVVLIVSTPRAFSPVQTSPPRLCLLDLPTLFVAFLI